MVEYRNKFIHRKVGLGFINGKLATTLQLRKQNVLSLLLQERVDKTVIFFHDASIYHVNEEQPSFWGEGNTRVLKPKSKGVVFDVVDERDDSRAV